MPSRKKNASTHYLAMWDILGLESIFNVTAHFKEVEEHEKKVMWQILKEDGFREVKPPDIPLNLMLLRARVNSQRSYEIYEFNSTMSEDELRNLFDRDPQSIVDWIRRNGYKIYSDYIVHSKKIIL